MWRERSGRLKLNHMSLKGCPPKRRGAPGEAAIFYLVRLQRIRPEQGADAGGELPSGRDAAHHAYALDAGAGLNSHPGVRGGMSLWRQLDAGDAGGRRTRRRETDVVSWPVHITLAAAPGARVFCCAGARRCGIVEEAESM
jgi:hypothetical protein